MAKVTACATLGYAAFDLETAVRQIAARGFEQVEITELGAYCRHFPYGRAQAECVGEILARHHLTPLAMNIGTARDVDGEIYRPIFSDPEQAPEIIKYARSFLHQARALSVGVMTLPIGPRVFGDAWLPQMQASCATYREIADTAGELDISLNLEVPHLFQLTDTVAHVAAVFEELDHPAVGATVDTSHWGIARYDVDEFFDFLGPRLRHVHLRDSAGEDTGDFKQQLEMTPGRGTVDFAKFGQALDRVGYGGDVSLEFEYRHDDLAKIEAEYDYGISYLKQTGWEFPEKVRTL